MKLSFLLLITVILCFTSLHASSKGFTGGLGFTGFNGSDIADAHDVGMDFPLKPGFYIGYFNDHQLSDKVSIRSEIAFNSRGANYDFDTYLLWLHIVDSGTYHLFYANVPVTCIVKLGNTQSGNKPYMGAGLSLSTPLYAHITSKDGYDSNIYEDINKFSVGYQLCGGVDMGSKFIEIRYDGQFSSIDDKNEAKQYNMAIWVLLGLRLSR